MHARPLFSVDKLLVVGCSCFGSKKILILLKLRYDYCGAYIGKFHHLLPLSLTIFVFLTVCKFFLFNRRYLNERKVS